MFPTTVILRRSTLAAVLAAVALPAGAAQASSSPSAAAQASASVTAQVHAQLSTAAAERFAATSTVRAQRALQRSQAQLRQAARLAVSAATSGDAQLAGAIDTRFATTVAADVEALSGVVQDTTGRLETAAAKAIREDVRLAAKVSAAVVTRAELGIDVALTSSMAETDAAKVAVLGHLAGSLDGDDIGAQARDLMRQALGAELAVRAAVGARVETLRDALEPAAQQLLTATVAALAQGSAAVSHAVDAMSTGSAKAHANADVSVLGVRVVADILAVLDASRPAPAAARSGR